MPRACARVTPGACVPDLGRSAKTSLSNRTAGAVSILYGWRLDRQHIANQSVECIMKCLIQFSLLIALTFFSGCVTTDRYTEFQRYAEEANGRFLGVFGFDLEVPGVPNFTQIYSYTTDVLVIPGTSDSFSSEEEYNFNVRAAKFARLHNIKLLKSKKRPNRKLQNTPDVLMPNAPGL
jgi:hypothetical protein